MVALSPTTQPLPTTHAGPTMALAPSVTVGCTALSWRLSLSPDRCCASSLLATCVFASPCLLSLRVEDSDGTVANRTENSP
jgi:hypothetical protein